MAFILAEYIVKEFCDWPSNGRYEDGIYGTREFCSDRLVSGSLREIVSVSEGIKRDQKTRAYRRDTSCTVQLGRIWHR